VHYLRPVSAVALTTSKAPVVGAERLKLFSLVLQTTFSAQQPLITSQRHKVYLRF
jgi:hypothetical protein